MTYRRPLSAGLLCFLLAPQGCYQVAQQRQEAPPTPGASISPAVQKTTEVPVTTYALPGGLDATPVFNSNSPEVVTRPGILLSTLPAANAEQVGVFQGFAFNGEFRVFSHHIAKDETPGERLLHLGLLAHNRGSRPVTLVLQRGATYLSQPDALFKPLAPMIPDPEGVVFAGPGDRVATDLLHERSPMTPSALTIPPGETRIIYALPIPTDVPIPPPVNGRSTLIHMVSNGPVYLSEVARFALKTPAGTFKVPTLADFQSELTRGALAGPRDLAPTAYDPASPVPKGTFRYGRVAGVSRGDAWRGTLFADPAGPKAPEPGQRVGFPVAGLFLNRLGTGQVQSAPMVTRYADTAYQAHGNYGVRYELAMTLPNPSWAPRTYTLTYSHPQRMVGDKPATAAVYLDPPNRPVMFRGPIKLVTSGSGQDLTEFTHLTLQHGQAMPPFARISVAPGRSVTARISLIYPADATPAQLLTVGCE